MIYETSRVTHEPFPRLPSLMCVLLAEGLGYPQRAPGGWYGLRKRVAGPVERLSGSRETGNVNINAFIKKVNIVLVAVALPDLQERKHLAGQGYC